MPLPPRLRAGLSLVVLVLAAAASLATSAPRHVRRYPTWRSERQDQVVDGAVVSAWVSRSGREGMGVSVEIDPRDTGMSFEVDPAGTLLRLGRRAIHPRRVIEAPSPPDRHRRYLVFPFDGRAAWNAGQRRAVLRLAIRGPGPTRVILVGLTHSLESPHTTLEQTPDPVPLRAARGGGP